jgi:hypothetical protein
MASSEAGLVLNHHLGPHADNVTIPLDLTQLCCPGLMLAAGLPSGSTTSGVGCWGGALWRACNLTSFSPCLTSPVDYLFASRHKGPRFESPGGYLCETGILLLALSRYSPPLLAKLTLLPIFFRAVTAHLSEVFEPLSKTWGDLCRSLEVDPDKRKLVLPRHHVGKLFSLQSGDPRSSPLEARLLYTLFLQLVLVLC